MKISVSMLAISLGMGVMMAQTAPATNPAPQDPQQKAAQADTKTNAQNDSKMSSTSPAEMKTSMFSGVLVDMACASHDSGGAAKSPSETAAAPAADQTHSADRAAGDAGSDCPVSANSTRFGLKMNDGRTVRFDLVGNQRAQDAVKNDKGWGKQLSANKPIHAKVSGVLNGDKLIVSSIH